MTNEYSASTQVRNMGLYRSGQDFNYDDLEYIADRELLAKFLIYTIPKKALSKGFTLKQGEEIHPDNDAIQKLYKQIKGDALKGTQLTGLYGEMVFELQKQGENDKLKVFLNMFDPRDIKQIEIDKFDNITKLEVQEKIKHHNEALESRPIDNNKLKNFLFRYRKGKRAKNDGLSKIEGSYDVHVGLQNLSESLIYFVIRVGAGLKILWVTQSQFDDEEYMNQLEADVKQMNAENTTMILQLDDNGQKQEIQLLTGQPIDFKTLQDFYYALIAIDSEVPLTILQGVTPGQLEGGKINETLLFDKLQNEQEEEDEYYHWICDGLAKFLDKDKDLGEYELEWVTREAVDDKAIQELLKLQIENLDSLVNIINLDFDKASKKVGFEFTSADLDQEKIAEKKAMTEAFMNRDDEDDTSEDDDTESTDTDDESTEEEEDE